MRSRETGVVLVALLAAVVLQACASAGDSTPCPPSMTACSTGCVDPTTFASDPDNCGGCGINCGANHTCVAGVCAKVFSRYIEAFTSGAVPTAQQCADFKAAVATGSTPGRIIKLAGSNDPVGDTCMDPATVASLVSAATILATGGSIPGSLSLPCNGRTWTVCSCGTLEITTAPSANCCACPAATAGVTTIRPCIGNANWGGAKTQTCFNVPAAGQPSQVLSLTIVR